MKNKPKNKAIAGILLVLALIILGSIFISYSISSSETYILESENLIEDGIFENFNKTSGDCCNTNPANSRVFASKSSDSFVGNYSLNLTSESQCACVSFPIPNFSNQDKYSLSFYTKGQNPRICNWVNHDKKCMPEYRLTQTDSWTNYLSILSFSELSVSSSIFFYADNREGQGVVTNLYDDLQVRKLSPIENPSEYKFNPEQEYVFKTKADNNVHDAELISEIDKTTGEAYFLTKGKPNVTIKFPWSEIVIVGLILFFVIRLLSKKDGKE